MLYLLWSVLNYYNLNNYNYSFSTTPHKFNNLLNNPLNKYHPAIFFISLTFLFNTSPYIEFSHSLRTSSSLNMQQVNTYKNLCSKFNILIFIVYISLYAGSWWALQEGSWGGWWNWDPSEVFGLLILIYFLFLLHTQYGPNPQYYSVYYYINWCIKILFLYTLIQTSYTVISHNFGLSILDYGFINLNFNLIILITSNLILLSPVLWLITTTTTVVINNPLYHTNKLTYKTTTTLISIKNILYNKSLYNYLTTVLIIYFILLKFNPIIYNVFWFTLDENFINKILPSTKLKLLIPIIVYLNFLLTTGFALIILLYYLYLYKIKWLFIFSKVYTSPSKISTILIHLTFFILMSLPIYLNNSLFVIWDYVSSNLTYYNLLKSRSTTLVDTSLESLSTITNIYINYNGSFITNLNSLFWINSNPVLKVFLLSQNDYVIHQTILNNDYILLILTHIYDVYTLSIDFLYFILSLLFIYNIFKKIKIIS